MPGWMGYQLQNPFIGPTYPLNSRVGSVARTVNLVPRPLESGNERTDWVFEDTIGLVAVNTTPNIVASFTYVGTLYDFVFTDTSQIDPVSWTWDFGDSTGSTTQNPTHTFTDNGTFQVKLTVSNSAGRTSSVTHPITIAISHADVLLLMHFDALPFVEERGRAVTNVGSVGLFTATPPVTNAYFGAASGGTFSSSSYLTMPSTSLLNLGTGPWVADCWVPACPSTSHPNYIFAMSKDGTSIYPMIGIFGTGDSGPWVFEAKFSSASAGSSYTASIDVSIANPGHQVWTFLRFGRIDATTVGVSINGSTPVTATISASDSFSPTDLANSKVFVGWTVNGDTSENGWGTGLDELCIRAEAMNSASFTPPTRAWIYP